MWKWHHNANNRARTHTQIYLYSFHRQKLKIFLWSCRYVTKPLNRKRIHTERFFRWFTWKYRAITKGEKKRYIAACCQGIAYVSPFLSFFVSLWFGVFALYAYFKLGYMSLSVCVGAFPLPKLIGIEFLERDWCDDRKNKIRRQLRTYARHVYTYMQIMPRNYIYAFIYLLLFKRYQTVCCIYISIYINVYISSHKWRHAWNNVSTSILRNKYELK